MIARIYLRLVLSTVRCVYLCKCIVRYFFHCIQKKYCICSPRINRSRLSKFVWICLYLIHLPTVNMRMDVFYVSVRYFFQCIQKKYCICSPHINTLKLRKFMWICLYLIHLTTLNMRMNVFYVSVKYFFQCIQKNTASAHPILTH
jgi:hypothetical protein